MKPERPLRRSHDPEELVFSPEVSTANDPDGMPPGYGSEGEPSTPYLPLWRAVPDPRGGPWWSPKNPVGAAPTKTDDGSP